AAIGTVVGNPWTFPFIWLWTYTLGRWVLGVAHSLTVRPEDFSFEHIINHPLEVLLPMVVGSVPTAVIAWFVFFWPLQRMVDGYQRARRRRLRKRLHQEIESALHPAPAAESEPEPAASPAVPRKFEGKR